MDTAWSQRETPLASPERAACVRQLHELRTIRDRDLPELLREARAFGTPDAEEVAQIHEDLQVVSAEIERLERLLPGGDDS